MPESFISAPTSWPGSGISDQPDTLPARDHPPTPPPALYGAIRLPAQSGLYHELSILRQEVGWTVLDDVGTPFFLSYARAEGQLAVQDPPGLGAALALGPDQPDYATNGLRALLKIRSYHHSYETTVNVPAKRIVTLAEDFPMEPSLVPAIDKTDSAFMPESHLGIFSIETAARSIQWRPFPGQELTLAEYARQIVERLDFKAEVCGIRAAHDRGHSRPGLILIDPSFIADEAGRLTLQSAIGKLPPWVLSLPVLNQPGDTRTRELARQVKDILGDAKVLPTDQSRRAAGGIGSLEEFVRFVPWLVADAERQYVRHRGGRVLSPTSAGRASPGRIMRPRGPATTPEREQEVPDA